MKSNLSQVLTKLSILVISIFTLVPTSQQEASAIPLAPLLDLTARRAVEGVLQGIANGLLEGSNQQAAPPSTPNPSPAETGNGSPARESHPSLPSIPSQEPDDGSYEIESYPESPTYPPAPSNHLREEVNDGSHDYNL